MKTLKKNTNELRYHNPIVKFGAIACLVLSIFASYITYEQYHVRNHLDKNGKIVEGLVLDKFTRTKTGYKSRKGHTSYKITYVFTPDLPLDDEIKGQAVVSQQDYIRFETNQTVKVDYATMDNRIVSRLTNYKKNDAKIGFGMSVWFMIAFLFLIKRKSPIKVSE